MSAMIAGIDEVGRGALAGPVVAGACILTCELFKRKTTSPRWSPFQKKPVEDVLIADSKLLTPEQREFSSEWIIEHCHIGIGIVSNEIVDERGILFATQTAMLLALQELCIQCTPESLLIDGNDHFRFPIPHQSIIRGDQTEPAIAAASIVAKVARDALMRGEMHARFPIYDFASHKGYGSALHMQSIREYGPCAIHRRTFLRSILENQSRSPAMTTGTVSN
jgi:ribonuclease HII